MYPVNLKNLSYLFFVILIVEGLSFLLCIPYALYFNEPVSPFYLSSLITIPVGTLFYIVSGKKIKLTRHHEERFVLLVFSWVVIIFVGTLPYILSKSISSPVDCIYETTSGFTATGSSIIPDISRLPRSVIFYRSLTQWMGGIGAIITAVLILPQLNVGGYKLFAMDRQIRHKASEKEGFPQFGFVVRRLVMVFIALTALQTLLLCLGGMDLFKSLCYSFGTVSTGCFSPGNGNLSEYSSYTQYVFVFFMLLSGFSYVMLYLLVTGKGKAIKSFGEARIYLLTTLSFTFIVTIILYFQTGKNLGISFRESVFQVSSLIASNGYSNASYLPWPNYILLLLFLLIFIGGSTGSASGGITIARLLIFFKNLKVLFKKLNTPSTRYMVKYNHENIDEVTNLSVVTFIIIFGIVFLLGTLALSAAGIDPKKSAFFAIAALTTFGHQVNLVNLSASGKFILSLLMLIGRTEVYPLLVLFTVLFYRNIEKIRITGHLNKEIEVDEERNN